ncbi:hypothetical protein PIB30_048618 [Stylosanthes scabra]|uniref:Uncharacterized protein n=1 Tax=Stylosanthes scabra TaxID=79078 RepID=A0ABU6TGR1_9FABA|nr:hypothetical protein [Stylosanthes scabra]
MGKSEVVESSWRKKKMNKGMKKKKKKKGLKQKRNIKVRIRVIKKGTRESQIIAQNVHTTSQTTTSSKAHKQEQEDENTTKQGPLSEFNNCHYRPPIKISTVQND